MAGAVVSVKGLKKVYGNKTAVDGISFEVKQGEWIGVIGRNVSPPGVAGSVPKSRQAPFNAEAGETVSGRQKNRCAGRTLRGSNWWRT